jgi:hypothetical protein
MQHLHNSTIEELHELTREQLITMLVNHDRDGEYSDEQRTSLGEETLNHQEALSLAVFHLNEVIEGEILKNLGGK